VERPDPGCDASVLSEFRTRLITGAAASRRFATLLTWGRDRPLVNARGRPRTDSTHSRAAVRALHRIEVVGATRRHVLNPLAVVVPAWLRAVRDPAWQGRYACRAEDDRLPTTPTAHAALALTIGHDSGRLLAAIDHPEAPPGLREVPAGAIRRRVWIQNDLGDGTQLQWREADNLPPAARCIRAPDAAEAHEARQHTTPWVGDTVPSPATCEEDRPPLIKHSDTTPGPTAEGAAPPQSHAELAQRGLLPGPHMVETGVLDADRLVHRRHDDSVDWLGPTHLDDHGQAREGAGGDAQQFQLDGDQHQVSGPAGQKRLSWTPAVDHRRNAVITGQDSSKDCRRGDHVAQGVRAKTRAPRRTRTIRPQPQS
jgi:transposase